MRRALTSRVQSNSRSRPATHHYSALIKKLSLSVCEIRLEPSSKHRLTSLAFTREIQRGEQCSGAEATVGRGGEWLGKAEVGGRNGPRGSLRQNKTHRDAVMIRHAKKGMTRSLWHRRLTIPNSMRPNRGASSSISATQRLTSEFYLAVLNVYYIIATVITDLDRSRSILDSFAKPVATDSNAVRWAGVERFERGPYNLHCVRRTRRIGGPDDHGTN